MFNLSPPSHDDEDFFFSALGLIANAASHGGVDLLSRASRVGLNHRQHFAAIQIYSGCIDRGTLPMTASRRVELHKWHLVLS